MSSPFFLSCPRLAAASAPAMVLLLIVSTGVFGQVTLVPRVSITETLTDNVRLSSANPLAEQITQVSPGILVNIDGARLKTHFDYSLTRVMYAQNSSPSRSQNTLNTFGTLEAVDNRVFVEFSGSISQQTVSAFGTQSIDNTAINANQSEVSNFRLSPYVRGRLGELASYEARYSRTVTRSDVAGSDVTTGDGSARLSGGSAYSKLGWSADLSQQRVAYSVGRTTETDRSNLGLSYAITSQLNVHANVGRETNNFTSIDKQGSGTRGFGLNWAPSELTKFSASKSQRPFGDTFIISADHRTARTAWKFSDSKDVSASPSQTGLASIGSIYDLLFSQFASIEPNPISRAQLVNAYLQANGMSPNTTVVSSFLTSALSLLRRQELSVALIGVRNTVTLMATRSESSRLDTVSTAVDDLASVSLVRQRGMSVNFAHRLTPDYSLGVLLSQQDTSGSSSDPETRLRSASANIAGKVGRKASASVGLRRVVSSSSVTHYAETSVTGNLNVQF